MTSVELLERAAKVLRDHAKALPNTMIGRWTARRGVVADDGTDVGMLVIDPYNPANDQPIIDFLALLDPRVAMALADVLEKAALADPIDFDEPPRNPKDRAVSLRMIRLALAILREDRVSEE